MGNDISYPKEFGLNLRRRAEMLAKAADDKMLREAVIEACIRSRLFFFNMMMYTYDPRLPLIKRVPFITYPFQDDTIMWDAKCGADQEDNLVDKSRDMGVTWMFVGNDLYDWLFSEEKIEIRWGSRKESYVDNRGDMDTIFEKFRYVLRYLPLWMLPDGFCFKEHDNYMRLINPETGSSITGEATNANFGRGGRKLRIRFDEFAFWENDESAWQSAADSTNCRTALSTVNGSANKFAELAQSGNINKRTLHWTLHPKKNKECYVYQNGQKTPISLEHDPNAAYKIWLEMRDIVPPAHFIGGLVRSKWYDKECNRRNDLKEVAEELDIDFLRSGLPFFDLRKVKHQTVWTQIERQRPTDPIPAGRFIKANLVEEGQKVVAREGYSGWCRIFELPKKFNQYVLGGDVAEGLEKGDECFAVVRDKHTRDVVATVKGLYDPDDFALKCQKMGAFYNKALVAVENNNQGYSTNSDLKEMDCNLYWTKKKNKKGEVTSKKAGWTTTAQSRPLMLDQAKAEVRQETCEVRDADILNQMTTFVHNEKTGKPEAEGKFKDDGVIAHSIAGRVIVENPYQPKKEKPKPTATIGTNKNAGFRFCKK